MTCPHRMCFKGTHPSFRKGLWLCADCQQYVDLKYLDGYGIVLAALRKDWNHTPAAPEEKR